MSYQFRLNSIMDPMVWKLSRGLIDKRGSFPEHTINSVKDNFEQGELIIGGTGG